MARKVPEWESELWSYLSKGDGMHCPLYDHCRIKKECTWCIDDHITEITQILEDRKLNIARCHFVAPEGERLGKPFQLVEKLALRYLEEGKVHSPPTPTELITLLDPERSVEIRTIPLTAYHGAIWGLKDNWIIQLKRTDTAVMKRHTIFHEAFHILAHRKGVPVFRKRGAEEGYFNEGLADYFAVCILMPREWVREKWAEVKDVGRIAKVFEVPKIAMWIRLRQMGLV